MQMKGLRMNVLARHPLTKKLAIVTAIKVAGLVALWWAFFSGHERVTPERAAAAILHPQAQQPGEARSGQGIWIRQHSNTTE